MSLAVRQGLFAKLSGSSSVTSLLSSPSAIYYGQAPSDAKFPYLILNKQAGTPTYALKGEAFKSDSWLVKAVDRGGSSNSAEAIAEAVDAVLNGGTLTVSGKTLADLRRTSDVDFLEESGDQTYRHHGALYRVVLT